MCDKWLATDDGDGLIERTLYESERKKRKKCKTHLVWGYGHGLVIFGSVVQFQVMSIILRGLTKKCIINL